MSPVAPSKNPPKRSATFIGGPTSRLRVSFYRRVKPQRVYPLTVQPTVQGKPQQGAPVVVRPIVPGAQVSPTECTLDLAKSDARATFQVMPVARGGLRDARVEVLSGGKVVETIKLPMYATTQRFTWLLFALMFLIPAFILYVTKYHPIKDTPPGSRVVRSTDAAPTEMPALAGEEARGGARPAGGREAPPGGAAPGGGRPGGPPGAGGPPAGGGRQRPPGEGGAAPGAGGPPGGGGGPPGGGGGGRPPGGGGGPGAAVVPGLPGSEEEPAGPTQTRLEREINSIFPDVPDEVAKKLPWEGGVTKNAAYYVSQGYDLAKVMVDDYLAFWIGFLLLLAMVFSWFVHRPIGARRRGGTLNLTNLANSSDTLEVVPAGR